MGGYPWELTMEWPKELIMKCSMEMTMDANHGC